VAACLILACVGNAAGLLAMWICKLPRSGTIKGRDRHFRHGGNHVDRAH
jgi:hypothetical protein